MYKHYIRTLFFILITSLVSYTQHFEKLILNIHFLPTEEKLIGNIHYYIAAKSVDNNTKRLLLSNTFSVQRIELDGVEIDYSHKNDTIYLEQSINNARFMKINYSGKPISAIKPPWEGGVTWSKDSLQRYWAGVSCQTEGPKVWWPYVASTFNRPDVTEMNFSINKKYSEIIIANGLDKGFTENDTSMIYHWKVSYPINPYNISFYLGNYKKIEYKYDSLSVNTYYLDYEASNAKQYFPEQYDKMFNTLYQLYGVYPFINDGYKLVHAPYWGMEHQSAIAYGNNLTINQFGFDFILLHETAHEYWGNNIYAATPTDYWLHESWATYTEALYIEKLHGYEQSIAYLQSLKKYIKNTESICKNDAVSMGSYTTSDMYYKGAWMLHTLRSVTICNDESWFLYIKTLYQHFAGIPISTDAFISFTNDYFGKDYTILLRQYLKHKNPPILLYKKDKKKYKMKWLTDEESFSMPLFIFGNITNNCIYLSNKWQTIDIKPKQLKLDNTKTYYVIPK